MPREYRHTRRVQFYETDAAGIVHFSWFFRYMEEAEHALWREAGLSIHPPDAEIGWPRVGAACEFHEADAACGVCESATAMAAKPATPAIDMTSPANDAFMTILPFESLRG